jgi:hypothetical protein
MRLNCQAWQGDDAGIALTLQLATDGGENNVS